MSAVSGPITEPLEPAGSGTDRQRRGQWLIGGARPLAGIALMAALLPLRGNWGADLVLVALAFTVPGVLALRAMRIPGETVADYPLYVLLASVAVMMAAGLGCDLIGPSLGVARPLHGVATAVATFILSLILWVLGVRAPAAARLRWAGLFDRPSLLAPMVLPALAALGALLLTNGHGNVAARTSAVIDVAALCFCLVRAPRMSRGQVAMLLFGCALAVEWASSLRSQEIVGFDMSTEIYIAQHTQTVGIWHPVHHNDAYGAMLSITILPSTLRSLTGVSPEVAFKVLFPVFTAVLPVSIFLVGERFLSRRFAVGAAALLLIQSYFFQLLPELARQEIALGFFAALLATLLAPNLGWRPRCALIIVLSAGLVTSHYSSAYLAIPMVILALLIHTVISRFRGMAVISVPLVCATIALGGGSALWYGAVTHSASNVTSFVTTLRDRGLNLLPNRGGNILASYLNGNNVKAVQPPQLEQIAVDNYRAQAGYIKPLPSANLPQYTLAPAAAVPSTPVRVKPLSNAMSAFVTLFNELMLALCVLGPIVMIFSRRTGQFAAQVAVLALGAAGFLVFIRFSGTAAADYNQTRALLESLIILALPAAWLAERLVGRAGRFRGAVWGVMVIAITLMFANQTGVADLALGGGTSLNLSAGGEDFERFYMTPAELAAAKWSTKASAHDILYADRYGQLRIYATSGRTVLTAVMPRTLDQHAWVYATRTNVRLHRARAEIGSVSGIYEWPSAFLNRYFDVVFDNGDSEVYHR